MKKLLISLAMTAAFAVNGFCAEKLAPELDALISHGIDSIYRLNFEVAEKDFNTVLEKYPGQPYGYFGLAMAQWGRLEYQHEESSTELSSLYEKETDEAIEKGEAWLKKYPKDPHAHLCVGGIYGLRSRLALMKHSWIKAYFSGKKGLKHMNTALKLDPELYDAYLGPGMYEYYAGTLPSVVRILAKLFVSGNPKKGLEYLTLVKDKGRYTATAAKLLLIEIYTQTGSKYSNPAIALQWAGELRKQYPDHPMIQFVEIVSLYECKKYDEVRASAEDYLKRIEKADSLYGPVYQPRALIALGTSYMAQKRWSEAIEAFARAVPTPGEKANRWAVWAVVRLGNIYDLQGDRKLAVTTYKHALEYEDLWGFKEFITRYIHNPYTLEEFPGQLPPP